jgi:CMP-N,N'-diacetyllegionaminic acid synthase
MKLYAIIPARSGSKGIANKNISLVDEKPLLSYSILFAKKISSVDRVFCSTDSGSYTKVPRQYLKRLPFCSLKCCNRYGYGGV